MTTRDDLMDRRGTFPLDKLREVTTIISHANCPDGVASAMVILDALRGDRRSGGAAADVQFMQYGSPELAALAPAPGMLFVDFSPPADVAPAFVEAGAIVLDHHKTARAVVESFGALGVFADEEREPGVSGAVLAFREVWLPLSGSWGTWRCLQVARFAGLAGVRDTWCTKDPAWPEACAQAEALRFWPASRWLDADVAQWRSLAEIGQVLVDKHATRVADAISEGFWFTSERGLVVAVLAGVDVTSDAAEKLGGDADLVMGFRYAGKSAKDGAPAAIWSCRSRGDFDVAAFAKYFGGGGHTHAAGFVEGLRVAGYGPHANPYTDAEELVRMFERRNDPPKPLPF